MTRWQNLNWPWAGVFGGAFFWYAAHDLSTYLSAHNCQHVWISPTIHIIALIGAVMSGWLSYRVWPRDDTTNFKYFSAGISTAAAGLFTLVIVWQGLATFIFHGCAR